MKRQNIISALALSLSVLTPVVAKAQSAQIDLDSFYVLRIPRNSETAKLLINRSVTISKAGDGESTVVSKNATSWELLGIPRSRDGINVSGITLWKGNLAEGETANVLFSFYASVESNTLTRLANVIGNISDGLIASGTPKAIAIGVAGKIGEEYVNKAAFKGVEGYMGTIQVSITRRGGKIVNNVLDTVAWGHGPLPTDRNHYWQGNPPGLPNGTDKFKLHAERSNDAEIWFYFRNPMSTNN